MVEGRGSKNYSKLFSNYFLTSSAQKFTGSCLLEFRCLLLPHLGRAEHQNLALSIFTVKLFFSEPQIQIKAEDNAYAEDAVTYRCHTQVVKQYCLFRAETQWFFLSNDSLGYEKIRQKNPQYQYQYRYQWITIED